MRYYGLCGKDQHKNFPVTKYVQNLAIRASWGHVQSARDTFDWGAVDAALAAMKPGGVAGLTIHTGDSTPSWVLDNCRTFTMKDGVKFPAPWDSNFLDALGTLIAAVGQKYNSDERLIRVVIPALCAATGETNLDNIGKRANKPTLHVTAAQTLAYWQSVGYTPRDAIYAVQQGTTMLQDAVHAAPCISFLPGVGGLDFDAVSGDSAIQSIQSWFSAQPNVLLYNCGASNHWVYPKSQFPHNAYVYQEASSQGTQKLFNRMMNLIYAQKVDELEVYASDLDFVPNAPPEPSGAAMVELVDEEYDGEYLPEPEEA